MTLQFTLKPFAVDAIGPKFFLWLWRYSVSAVLIYYLADFFHYQTPALATALVIIVIVASFLSIKHALIKNHMTKYSFFDTHVEIESGLIIKTRESIPYKQVSKVMNTSTLWNRVTGASDIILKALNHEVRLKSIRNANEVEAKIYKILRSHKK